MALYNYPNGIDPAGTTGTGPVLGRQKVITQTPVQYIGPGAINLGTLAEGSITVLTGACTFAIPNAGQTTADGIVVIGSGGGATLENTTTEDFGALVLGANNFFHNVRFLGPNLFGVDTDSGGHTFHSCQFDKKGDGAYDGFDFTSGGYGGESVRLVNCTQPAGSGTTSHGFSFTGKEVSIEGCSFAEVGTSVRSVSSMIRIEGCTFGSGSILYDETSTTAIVDTSFVDGARMTITESTP